MHHAANESHHPDGRGAGGGFWRLRTGFVFAAFLGIAVFLLLIEQWALAFGVLPFLLLLACPLLHAFMHRGHGSHGIQRDVKGD